MTCSPRDPRGQSLVTHTLSTYIYKCTKRETPPPHPQKETTTKELEEEEKTGISDLWVENKWSPERDVKRRNEGDEGEGEVKHTMLWGTAVGQTASALSSLWLS